MKSTKEEPISFDFNFDHLEKEDLIEINRSLKEKNVTNLNLALNDLENASFTELMQNIKKNKTLKKLNLQENRINTEKLKALSEMLEENNSITELYLDSNEFSD